MSDTCNVCNGTGSLTCNKCGGYGGVKCFKCEGSGYIATPVAWDQPTWRHNIAPERGSRQCFKCGGTGTLPCFKCQATGRVTCRKCNGTGMYTRGGYSSPSYTSNREEPRVTGTVKFYNRDKGFGFIAPDSGGSDVHVNRKNLQEVSELSQGDRVEFVQREGDKGPWAAFVTIV